MPIVGVPTTEPPADFENELVAGFAVLLEQAELGVWNPSGALPVGGTLITQQAAPADVSRLIALTAYGVDDSGATSSTYGLLVRTRWEGADPRPVNRLAGDIFRALHQRADFTLWTGIRVYFIERVSWTTLGQDGSKRWSRTDNYYVTAHRPTPNRR
jgi:hypothetical protein